MLYSKLITKLRNCWFKVSETDMYLLGAIEKLVQRMDSMEKRLKRSEELIQHIVEGSAANREG